MEYRLQFRDSHVSGRVHAHQNFCPQQQSQTMAEAAAAALNVNVSEPALLAALFAVLIAVSLASLAVAAVPGACSATRIIALLNSTSVFLFSVFKFIRRRVRLARANGSGSGNGNGSAVDGGGWTRFLTQQLSLTEYACHFAVLAADVAAASLWMVCTAV